MSRRGILFVLSAPSGAGKDTLLSRVLTMCPDVERCVTYTTRAPRPGEVEGVDYHFVDAPTFRAMRDGGLFLEWAEVYQNYYGNSRQWVEERLLSGRSVVLRIDVQGSLTIRQLFPDAVLIFVEPPSAMEQERRLRSRETESEANLKIRLEASEWEMAQIPAFDYRVVNDNLEGAVDLVRCIIKAEHARISPAT